MNASTTSPLIGVHHVALIAADYARSKDFYTRVLVPIAKVTTCS